jgi:hypothetical protein
MRLGIITTSGVKVIYEILYEFLKTTTPAALPAITTTLIWSP